jgi:hypothetical protein
MATVRFIISVVQEHSMQNAARDLAAQTGVGAPKPIFALD